MCQILAPDHSVRWQTVPQGSRAPPFPSLAAWDHPAMNLSSQKVRFGVSCRVHVRPVRVRISVHFPLFARTTRVFTFRLISHYSGSTPNRPVISLITPFFVHPASVVPLLFLYSFLLPVCHYQHTRGSIYALNQRLAGEPG